MLDASDRVQKAAKKYRKKPLSALGYALNNKQINWIVDTEVKAFFDRSDRDQLINFVENRIGDRRLVRLILKWLNAGVMDDGRRRDGRKDTGQGAVVSQVLANLYMHHVFDLWFCRTWHKNAETGNAVIVLYADEFVLGFKRKRGTNPLL